MSSYRLYSARKRKHRLAAAKALGRPLTPTEVVHHFTDAQLVICQDQAYHLFLHVRTRVVAAGGDPNTHRYCSKCKTCKPFAAFKPRHDRPSGRESICRSCRNAAYHLAGEGE